MKISVIVQARMSSERLPGKMLKEIHDKPILEYLCDRLSEMKSVDEFVVATSTETSDDPIHAYCTEKGYECYRGSLTDVTKRFCDVATHYELDAFVRINGDSPFIDPALVDKLVSKFKKGEFDVVTNVLTRTYPKGQSVEVVRVKSIKQAYGRFDKPSDKEHVTPYFYKNKEKFKIFDFHLENEDFSKINLCVDDPETFASAEQIISAMTRSHEEYSWREVLELKKQGARVA